MDIDTLRALAGIKNLASMNPVQTGSNISMTGTEKAAIQQERKIEPGTPEWFKLWFAKPYLTGEKPI